MKGGAARAAGALLAAGLAAGTLAAGTAGGEERFSDVPASHPQREAILFAADRGWFQGYPDGSFRPDGAVPGGQLAAVVGRAFPEGASRADLASFMLAGVRTLGRDPVGGPGCEWPVFADVTYRNPQSWDILYAADFGWFEGYPDGSFRPDGAVPGGQLAAVVGRAFPEGASRADLALFMRAGAQELARINRGDPENNFFTYELHSDQRRELWVAGTDGSEPRRLTENVYYWRWSPDGRTLAYSARDGGGEQIWVFDAATSQTRMLGEHAVGEWRNDLWWSGDILTYTGTLADGVRGIRELWVYEGPDLRPRRLSADGWTFLTSRGAGTIKYSTIARDAAGELTGTEVWSYDFYADRRRRLLSLDGFLERYEFSHGDKCLAYLIEEASEPASPEGAAASFSGFGFPAASGYGNPAVGFSLPLTLTGLRVADFSGGGPRRLLENPDFFFRYKWSPDGRRLAYQVEQVDERGKRTGETGLWMIEVDGSAGPYKLADDVSDFHSGYRWSPSGGSIAFREPIYDEDGYWLHAYRLWTADADRRVRRRLTAPSDGEWFYTGFGWSDDGTVRYSAVQRNEEGETVDRGVWEADEDGSNQRRHVPLFPGSVILEESPDGGKTAYVTEVRNAQGIWMEDELWLADADGSDRRRLAGGLGNILFMYWSSDGEMIAFWSEKRDAAGRQVGDELWLAAADGSPPRLAAVADSTHRVEWPRTGEWVAYGLDGELWMAKRDGSESRLLKDDTAWNWHWN